MEKVMYNIYSCLLDRYAHLSPCPLRWRRGWISRPSVLPSEVRHTIRVAKNGTASGPDRIRPEHLKNLPPGLVSTLTSFFTRNLQVS